MGSDAPSLPFRAPWWWKLLRPHRGPLGLGLLATLVCSLAASWVPWWAGRAVAFLEQGQLAASRRALLWMLAVTLVAGLGRYLMRNTLIGLSRTIEKLQREEVFAFLLARPFAFFDRQRVGDLMSRIGDDVSTVRMATGPGLMSLLQTASILPMTLFLMVHTSPRLTLAVMIPFSFLALAFFLIGKRTHATQQQIQRVTSDLTTLSHETISGEKVVQAFGLEEERVAAFRDLSRHQAKLNIRQTVLYATYLPVVGVLSGLALLVLVVYGGRLVVQKTLHLGDLTAFSGYLVALAWPMMSLGWSANLFQRGQAGQERIDQLLQAPEAPLPQDSGVLPDPRPVSLQMQGLIHRFENGRGLGPLDLQLPAGGSLALLGGIGCGKTVLLQVLAGLREPQGGQLLLDGHPASKDRLRAHWSGLGWVPQEAFLFSSTLRENLAMGRPEATEAELEEVVRTVCMDDLIPRLPQGLDTVVGERGVALSGGERQRTALARALLRRPRLLLLDDALSAVDAETETRILANLRAFLGQSTLVLATHRVFVAELCDRVVVLDEGIIQQQGTPAELAERPGTFARLKRLQSLERELMGT